MEFVESYRKSWILWGVGIIWRHFSQEGSAPSEYGSIYLVNVYVLEWPKPIHLLEDMTNQEIE